MILSAGKGCSPLSPQLYRPRPRPFSGRGAIFVFSQRFLSLRQKIALVLFPFPYYNMLIGFCPKSVSFAERSLHYDQHHQRQRKHPYYR